MMDMWLFSESKLRTKFDTIGSIMLYNKNILLDENNFSNRNLLKLYNGSGNLAEKYSLVIEQYFNAFKEYNNE